MTREAAREAYARGQELYRQQEFAAAALEFERAHREMPSPQAIGTQAVSMARAGDCARASAVWAQALQVPGMRELPEFSLYQGFINECQPVGVVGKVQQFGQQFWGAVTGQQPPSYSGYQQPGMPGMSTGKPGVQQNIIQAVNMGMNAGATDAGVLPAAPPSLFQSVVPRLPWILGGVLVVVGGVVIYKAVKGK